MERTFGKNRFNARIAVNKVDRKDFSKVNDTEVGWGPGLRIWLSSILREFLYRNSAGLVVSIDRLGRCNCKSFGRQFQHFGFSTYTYPLAMSLGSQMNGEYHWQLQMDFEINMFTHGDEVAQGWITMGQLRIIRRFE